MRYTVQLRLETTEYADLDVEAESPEQAKEVALREVRDEGEERLRSREIVACDYEVPDFDGDEVFEVFEADDLDPTHPDYLLQLEDREAGGDATIA